MERSERFERIYRRHVDVVHAYARRRAAADLAEEAVAETFLVCWRRLDRVPQEPLPWLYGVARKALANQRRALRRRREAERPLAAHDAEAAVALGCSHVACRVRFHRAKARFARLLEADGPLPRPRTEGAHR